MYLGGVRSMFSQGSAQGLSRKMPEVDKSAVGDEIPFLRPLSVSGERESVYFWRLGMHFFFGGSSSP